MKDMEEQKGFDLTVTHRDPKSGAVTKKNPYTLRVIGQGANGKTQLWERPVGSGNLWNKAGEPIGRWEDGKFCEGVAHVTFVPAETENVKFARTANEQAAKIAQLERELAAIKAEGKAPKSAPSDKK